MSDDKLSTTAKGLLGAAGIAGTGGALVAKQIHDSNKKKKRAARARKLAGMAERRRLVNRHPGRGQDPRAYRAEVAAETGGKKYRDQVKAARVQRRANRARQRVGLQPSKSAGEARVLRKAGKAAARTAKGTGRALGIGGAAATMPSTVKNATSAAREGGSWMNRFGKFVERQLGMPAGSSGRGATKKELESMFKM